MAFKRPELVVVILRQHIPLRHIGVDNFLPRRRDRLQIGVALLRLLLHVREPGVRRGLCLHNPRIESPRLDRADQALDHQRHNVAPEGIVQRRVAHRLQQRQHPVHRRRPRIYQRLDLVMQIGMPHLLHIDHALHRRGDNNIVRPYTRALVSLGASIGSITTMKRRPS